MLREGAGVTNFSRQSTGGTGKKVRNARIRTRRLSNMKE